MTLASCAPVASPIASPAPQVVAAGGAYAEQRCAACHAIGLADASPRPAAPPLRDFFKRFPRADVQAAFIAGVHLGAPDMPTFRMSEAEADQLVEYLRALDPCSQESANQSEMARCFSPL
jgi:mono/diheme cytochrome c family protein